MDDDVAQPVSLPDRRRLDALEQLYEEHHRQALGLAYQLLRDSGESEEVVQEAFLSAWRAQDRYDARLGSQRTWILTMVRNRCIDVLRARKRRPVDPIDEQFDLADGADVSAQAITSVEATRARQAMAALPPEQQEVIELAYFRGLTHFEIADKLATPVGTIKGRIRLALDRLRRNLGSQIAIA
jgi:RNA polymerase sigma-70 factor (ECF subfamily)